MVEESWIDDVTTTGATDDTVDDSAAAAEIGTVFTSVPATTGGGDV